VFLATSYYTALPDRRTQSKAVSQVSPFTMRLLHKHTVALHGTRQMEKYVLRVACCVTECCDVIYKQTATGQALLKTDQADDEVQRYFYRHNRIRDMTVTYHS